MNTDERPDRRRLAVAFRDGHRSGELWGLVLLVTWSTFGLANVGSHRGYQPISVVTFVFTLMFVVALLVGRLPLTIPRLRESALALVVLTIGSLVVFQPTYMMTSDAVVMRTTVFVGTLVLTILWLLPWRDAPVVSLALVSALLMVTAWGPIRGVPIPGNDVWFFLQQGIEGTWRGQNMYRLSWTGVPAGQVQEEFTYLPMSAILLAPARWLTGDVRWGLALAVAASAAVLLAARTNNCRRRLGLAVVPACLLPLTPGHPLQVEMAWTEPILLLLLLSAVLATTREHHVVALVSLALALAAKQHVWLLVPIFMSWRAFGIRRTVIASAGAALLMLPWVVADVSAMYHDTVEYFLDLGENDRSSTVYAAFAEAGHSLPAAVSGAVVLAVTVVGVVCIRRTGTGASHVCLAASAVLLTTSLVNKQAFYNQWWLAGSLMLSALAFAGSGGGDTVSEAPVETVREAT